MNSADLTAVGGYIVGVGGAISILFSKVKNQNYNDLKERVRILEQERKSSRDEHILNKEAIAKLEGKLEAYKEIPLKFIPEALETLIKSNASILETLNKSAEIADEAIYDGGLLVKTKKGII